MQKIIQLLQNLRVIFQKYTLVLASSLTMAITAILLIEDNDISDATELIFIKILITSALGISLLFGLYMFSQRYAKRYIFEAIGLLLLGAFYFLLPEDKEKWNIIQIIMIFSSSVLTHLFVAFAPFWNSNEEVPFWQYNKSLFIGVVQTSIFNQVMIAGVLLAVVAVDNLFGIDINEKIYPELSVFIGIFGSTVIFILFQKGGLEKMQVENSYPIVLKFFTQFILIPLLLLYGVILYLYMFKILINFNLPHGWVSYMVLAYSIFGILALLLVHPLRAKGAKSWVYWFHRIFFYTLIPLVLLLFVAINTRILQYGFTEARCFVLLSAIWLTGIVCYFLFFKKTHIKIIPISLFLLLALSLCIPYFNVFSISIRSQEKVLKKILTENNLLINGEIDFSKKIADSVANNIEDKFEYLSERFEYQTLKSFLNEDVIKSFKNKKKWDIQGMFKNIEKNASNHASFILKNQNEYFDCRNYDFIVTQSQLDHNEITIQGDVFNLEHNCFIDKPFYKLKINDRETLDFMPLIIEKLRPYKNAQGEGTCSNLSIETKLGKYQIKVAFSSINKTMDSKINNYYLENVVFFFKKK